jgi:hypothetical protein
MGIFNVLSFFFCRHGSLFVVPVLDAFAKFEKRLLSLSCPSVRMEQLGIHWTDFHGI